MLPGYTTLPFYFLFFSIERGPHCLLGLLVLHPCHTPFLVRPALVGIFLSVSSRYTAATPFRLYFLSCGLLSIILIP
jgi:hypothetical protein